MSHRRDSSRWIYRSNSSGGYLVKCTNKVRIVGKHGTCYDASLSKPVKKTETSQHAKQTCSFCGKTKKRRAVGTSGGAWTFTTTSAITVKAASERRLRNRRTRRRTPCPTQM
ncbi:TPA: ribosomal protein L37a-like [Bos taurus]|nr:TPA: ribosomal protein L37a-like [Bos taurus]